MLRVKQHFVPDGQLHVPPVGVLLCLASILLLQKQRPRLRSDVCHLVGGGLAGASGDGWVRRTRRGEGPARVLTAIGVKRSVARAQSGSGVIDRSLDSTTVPDSESP